LKYLIEKISTGSFGTIYEVLGEDDNKTYALKDPLGLKTTSAFKDISGLLGFKEAHHLVLVFGMK
jgi:hypothetical protein